MFYSLFHSFEHSFWCFKHMGVKSNSLTLDSFVISHMSMHELPPNQTLLAAGSNELLIAKTVQQSEMYYVPLYCNHPPWSWLDPKWVVAVLDSGGKKVLAHRTMMLISTMFFFFFSFTFKTLKWPGWCSFPNSLSPPGGGIPLLSGR